MPYQKCRFADGVEVYCLNLRESKFLYREVQGYLKRGIRLRRNAVVFDVGANIGLFTITALKATGGTAKIFAFEPVLEIFEVLRANTEGMDAGRVRVFPFGLGSEAGEVEFTYYPGTPAMSRQSPGFSAQEVASWKESFRDQLKTLAAGRKAPLSLKVLSCLPVFLQRWLLDLRIRKEFRERVVVSRLETLRKVIAEERVERIDLLKIDVEGAELDVLLGMGEDDWKKVYQVVIEVHDLDGRLDAVRELLDGHGLSEVDVNRNTIPWATEICTVFARRRSHGEGAGAASPAKA